MDTVDLLKYINYLKHQNMIRNWRVVSAIPPCLCMLLSVTWVYWIF